MRPCPTRSHWLDDTPPARHEVVQHHILRSSSTLPRAPQLGQTQSTVPPTILREDRVSVRPHFTQNIQEGDHVRVPTTHVEPGSSSIGPNLPGPMKEPWPSAGGYKYPLFPEGQVFIILPIHLIIVCSCFYLLQHRSVLQVPPTSFKKLSARSQP